MAYYIVGLIKSKTKVVEGYVIIDSKNNDKISLVSKDNLKANMEQNEYIIANAKYTAKGIVGRYYPLSSLSSIIVSGHKRRLEDNGVLAVYSLDMPGSQRGLGYRCFRLRLDPLKSDMGTATYESLMNPNVHLINKENGTITTGSEQNLGNRQTLTWEAGVEKQLADKKQVEMEKKDKELSNDEKLDNMLRKLAPSLFNDADPNKEYTREELLEALNAKMLNPYVDVTYDEFRIYMLINNWSYKVKYLSACGSEDSAKLQLEEIDQNCKVLHVPDNVLKVILSDDTNPVNYNFDLCYINNDNVNEFRMPGSSIASSSTLTFGIFAYGGSKLKTNVTSPGVISYSQKLKSIQIGKLIIPNLTELIGLDGICQIGEVDLSSVSDICNCFNGTQFVNIPMLGSNIIKIHNSFNNSNILRNQDLSALTNIMVIDESFSNLQCNAINIESSSLVKIIGSFNNVDGLGRLSLIQCKKLQLLCTSFNNCTISSIDLPFISDEEATDSNRVNLEISRCFSDSKCSKIIIPKSTVNFEYCFGKCDQDIYIEIYPNIKNYSDNYTRNNVGISYLKGYRPNFKFSIRNFEIPNSDFYVAERAIKLGRDAVNMSQFMSIDVSEILPKNSVFHPRALTKIPLGLFDTLDFEKMTRIRESFFGSTNKNDEDLKCYIDTLVINKNINSISEYGFAGITGVSRIYLSPDIEYIDTKAFTKNYVSSICTVYTTKDSQACKILKNKSGFKLIIVDDFDKAVAEMKEDFHKNEAIPAKFNIMLRNNQIYSGLLQPKYATYIKQAYAYLRKIETGLSEQMIAAIPALNTSMWSKNENIGQYKNSDLFRLIIDGQMAIIGGIPDSPEADLIFNGLNNLFTTVMGSSDELLTKNETIINMSRFYATKINRVSSNNKAVNNTELCQYIEEAINEKSTLYHLKIDVSRGDRDKKELDDLIDRYIQKFENSKFPVETLIEYIKSISLNEYSDSSLAYSAKSAIEKYSKFGLKILYSDNNKSAIFALNVNSTVIDAKNIVDSNSVSDSFAALFIVYHGEVVWARPLLSSLSYRSRFKVNYNNINRCSHISTFDLKEGDIISSLDNNTTQIVGGMKLDNEILKTVILKAANDLSNGLVRTTYNIPSYHTSNSQGDASQLLLRVKSSLFPIAGKSKSGKFFTQLVYDVFMQRFYEIEGCMSPNRTASSDLGKHATFEDFISIHILKVWELSQISEIPDEYFRILRIGERGITEEFAELKSAFNQYEKFKLSDKTYDISNQLNDADYYSRNNEQREMLLDTADSLWDKIETAKPTVKLFNRLEKLGLVASFRTKPSSLLEKIYRSYSRTLNKQLDIDTAVKELTLRDEYIRSRSADSMIDTGRLKSSSSKVLDDHLTDNVLFTNYLYYHDEPNKITDKIKTIYTSLQPIDKLLKLIKIIGAARAEGAEGLGGLSNDFNKSIVSTSQIVPFYRQYGMKFKISADGKDVVIGMSNKYDSIDTDRGYNEYKIGIGIDIGNADVYSIALYGNSVIVLFRHDDLKSAALFQLLLLHNKQWATMVYGILNNGDINECGELYALREMIIKGYNSSIPFVDTAIRKFGITNEKLIQSLEYHFDSSILNLLTKQMRQ